MNETDKKDWREAAAEEYRQKREALAAADRRLGDEISELERDRAKFKREIADLDAAARVFGLVAPNQVQDIVESGTGPERKLFKDVAISTLKGAYPKPVSAKTIQEAAEMLLDGDFHPKTAGMTLYRLSQDGIARRVGHKWFYVPQTGDGIAESPEDDSPGLPEIFR